MKITKLAHSCLLVELPAPVNRTVLFDPGKMSSVYIEAARLEFLDDIVITHGHFDHFDKPVVVQLAQRFPAVRIVAPQAVVDELAEAGVAASATPPQGLEVFAAPHEDLAPLGETPAAIGVHYLGALTHPGDSHHFTVSQAVLALPVTAPWGATTTAVRLASRLKPRYVIPIHDWMWKDDWRQQMYDGMAQYFEGQGITFIKPVDGEPFVLDAEVTPTATGKDTQDGSQAEADDPAAMTGTVQA